MEMSSKGLEVVARELDSQAKIDLGHAQVATEQEMTRKGPEDVGSPHQATEPKTNSRVAHNLATLKSQIIKTQ